MYLVKVIKTFCDSLAPVEESLRQVGTTFKVDTKERVDILVKAGVVEIVEEPVKKEIGVPKVEEVIEPKIEEEVIEPKEEEIVVVKTTKSYNGGKKNGRKQSTKLGRKNS